MKIARRWRTSLQPKNGTGLENELGQPRPFRLMANIFCSSYICRGDYDGIGCIDSNCQDIARSRREAEALAPAAPVAAGVKQRFRG